MDFDETPHQKSPKKLFHHEVFVKIPNSPGNQYWYNLNGIISRACIKKNMETLSLSDFKIYSEDWSWQQTNRHREHKTTYPDHSTQGIKCSIITICLQKPMIAKIVHLSQPSRLVCICIQHSIRLVVREKKKRSESVLQQKPLYKRKYQRGNVTTQTHHQKVQLHSDCGPT